MTAGFITLKIEGMSCMSCATKVDQALRNVEGVVAVHVDIESNKAVVSGGDSAALIAAVDAIGFNATA